MEVQGELNRIAGTSGRGEAYCAHLIALSVNPLAPYMETVGSLNVAAGTNGLALQGACNALAGTDGLGAPLALSLVAPI